MKNLWVIFLLVASGAFGSVLWDRNYGWGAESADNTPCGIARDSEGNLWIAGSIVLSGGEHDWGIMEYSPLGETLLVKTYGSPGIADASYDMVYDGGNYLYIIGKFGGKFTIMKFDMSLGDTVWTIMIGYNSYGKAITLDNAGNICAVGTYGMFMNVVKYAPDGTFLYGNAEVEGSPSALTTDGDNVYAAGYKYGDNNDWVVAKYNSTLSKQWEEIYDGSQSSDCNIPTAIVTDLDSNVYCGGSPDQLGTSKIWALVKFDGSTGDPLWTREITGSTGCIRAITVCANNNVYVTGDRAGVMYTVKYYPEGDTSWIRSHSEGSGVSTGQDITIVENYVVVAGQFGASGNYSDAALAIYKRSGGIEIGVEKWGKTGAQYESALKLVLSGDTIYTCGQGPKEGCPNCRNWLTLKWLPLVSIEELVSKEAKLVKKMMDNKYLFELQLPKAEDLEVNVFDIAGCKVDNLSFPAKSEHQIIWPNKHFPAGVYFMSFHSSSTQVNTKLFLLDMNK